MPGVEVIGVRVKGSGMLGLVPDCEVTVEVLGAVMIGVISVGVAVIGVPEMSL